MWVTLYLSIGISAAVVYDWFHYGRFESDAPMRGIVFVLLAWPIVAASFLWSWWRSW